jgi:DivIVA domain-containing protein
MHRQSELCRASGDVVMEATAPALLVNRGSLIEGDDITARRHTGSLAELPAVRPLWQRGGMVPQFKLTMRGYDPHQVDQFLSQLSADPDLPAPEFAEVMRGYDQKQVDAHIKHVKAVRNPPLG